MDELGPAVRGIRALHPLRGAAVLKELAEQHGVSKVSSELWNLASESNAEPRELSHLIEIVGRTEMGAFAPLVAEHGLKHGALEVKRAAVEALGNLGDSQSLALALGDDKIALASAKALAEMKGPAIKPAVKLIVEKGFASSSPEVRKNLVKALVSAGAFDALFEKAIAPALDDELHDAASRAFGAAGYPAVEKLEKMGLQSKDLTHRVSAARALSKIIFHEPAGRELAIQHLINHMYAPAQPSRTVRIVCEKELESAAAKLEDFSRKIQKRGSKATEDDKVAVNDADFAVYLIRDALKKKKDSDSK